MYTWYFGSMTRGVIAPALYNFPFCEVFVVKNQDYNLTKVDFFISQVLKLLPRCVLCCFSLLL